MSDDDLEIIPLLEDVLVAGDLDKAVTGDIDVKDLESIESFDALFDESDADSSDTDSDKNYLDEDNSKDDSTLEFKDEIEVASAETSNDDSFEVSGYDSLSEEQKNDYQENVANDSVTEPISYEEVETTEENIFTDDVNEAEFELSEAISANQDDITNENGTDDFSESSFIQEANDLADSNQAIIEHAFDDIEPEDVLEDDFDGQDDTALNDTETTPEPENNLHEIVSEPEPGPQLDTDQIIEKVMQEIMPELETQIRSIVLASLEKHLTESVSKQASEPNTDDDQDL